MPAMAHFAVWATSSQTERAAPAPVNVDQSLITVFTRTADHAVRLFIVGNVKCPLHRCEALIPLFQSCLEVGSVYWLRGIWLRGLTASGEDA